MVVVAAGANSRVLKGVIRLDALARSLTVSISMLSVYREVI